MAKSSASRTKSHAHRIAGEGKNVRDRIKDLTVRAIGDRNVSKKDLSSLFNQVLEGARQGVRDALPQSQKNVLRQVVEGLNEAAGIAGRSGASALRDVKARGERIARKDATAAARGLREANDQFLKTAGAFARRLSGEVREEVEGVVARARRAGPRIRSAAGGAIEAADGHLLELTGETARAGVRMARGAFSGLMMATGGLLEGLGESVAPRKKAATSPSRPQRTSPARKRAKVAKTPSRTKKRGTKRRQSR